MNRGRRNSGTTDLLTILLYLVLVTIGWFCIYSAEYTEGGLMLFNFFSDQSLENYDKQFIWIIISIVIGFFILLIDGNFLTTISPVIYGIGLLALVGVLFLGQEVAGNQAWFQLGSFKLQPSEFTKFATNLMLAKYLSGLGINLKNPRNLIMALAIVLIPLILILLQGDAGTAIIFLAFALVLYREGMSGAIVLTGVALIILSLMSLLIDKWIIITIFSVLSIAYMIAVWKRNRNVGLIILGIAFVASTYVFSFDYIFQNVLKPHQQTRVLVMIGQVDDLKRDAYNVYQSKITIGSGGFAGKGYLEGTQTRFNFVPELSTDFIFCTVGEEFGFLGSLVIIVLYIFLMVRIILLAERQRSNFSRIYGYGVALILFMHFIINIGMTIGLVPVIGIPLPYISYGGSSVLAFTILLFIFIKLDSERLMILR